MATYRTLVSVVFAAVLTLSLAVSAVAAGQAGTYRKVDDAYSELNRFRTGNEAWYWSSDNRTKVNQVGKLQPLKRDADLERTAQIRARELATTFSHTRPDGTSCFTAYPDCRAVGENVAAGQDTAQDVTEDWKETSDPYSGQGHRRNMLSSKYNAVGIACYVDPDGTPYWVQAFGRV